MQPAGRQFDAPPGSPRCTLFDIAQTLGVPVVVASYRGANGVPTHATFGLDLDVSWAMLAQAIDQLCATGAVIVANIADDARLSRLAKPLLARDTRFFVGVPLRDYQARRVGCIAAFASQSFVARRGISVSRLGQLGRQFAGVSL